MKTENGSGGSEMNDKTKLELFKKLQTHALSTACACKVCRRLREAHAEDREDYIKELKSKAGLK